MSDQSDLSERVDAVVVGGGIHGCTLALFLARGGMSVALVDRGPLCREASGTNAGTLTMQMTRVALIPYALKGHEMWATAGEWLGHNVGTVICDGLSLAFTEREAEILAYRAGKRREAGAPIDLISPARAREAEPGLSRHPILAAYCPVDGYTSAYQTGLAYRRALTDAGVALHEGVAATGLESQGSAHTVILADGRRLAATRLALCGGVWLEQMCSWLGVHLPIKVLVNQLAVTERMPKVMRTVVGIASGLLSLKQFANGTIVIGGGWQGIGDRTLGVTAPRPEALVGNVRLACHAIPAMRGGRLARAWCGFEAETADAMPVVGPIPRVENAFICGSVHSGYTSGLYIARLLADHMLGREPALPLFPVDRLLNDTVDGELSSTVAPA